jgi:flavodoxin
LEIFIIYGGTRHTFNFSYATTQEKSRDPNLSESLTTMKDLKAKASKDLNFEQGIIFTDEYGNILLDSLDIVETLYPFYQFQVKKNYPQILAILPYGWDAMKFVSQGAAMAAQFEEENKIINQNFELSKKKLIESSRKREETVEVIETFETQKSFAGQIIFFLKKSSRMLYMITIIAAYWSVFVTRSRVLDNFK